MHGSGENGPVIDEDMFKGGGSVMHGEVLFLLVFCAVICGLRNSLREASGWLVSAFALSPSGYPAR